MVLAPRAAARTAEGRAEGCGPEAGREPEREPARGAGQDHAGARGETPKSPGRERAAGPSTAERRGPPNRKGRVFRAPLPPERLLPNAHAWAAEAGISSPVL